MARKISLKLSGKAEKFLLEMEAEGLNEADVISKALSILETVWKTNRVALIREPLPSEKPAAPDIEYYFQVVSKEDNKQERTRSETSPAVRIPPPPDANSASPVQ